MADILNSACFSGHRKLSRSEEISRITEAEIVKLIDRGVMRFLAGGAIGFDTLASSAVLRQRRGYPHIELICVLPCPPEAQSKYWNAEQKQDYFEILNKADNIIVLSDKYHRGCMYDRNRYLVDNSSYCICYLTESSGGTAYTAKRAYQKGLTVINTADIIV